MEFFFVNQIFFLSILTLDYVDHDKYIEEWVERTYRKKSVHVHMCIQV